MHIKKQLALTLSQNMRAIRSCVCMSVPQCACVSRYATTHAHAQPERTQAHSVRTTRVKSKIQGHFPTSKPTCRVPVWLSGEVGTMVTSSAMT